MRPDGLPRSLALMLVSVLAFHPILAHAFDVPGGLYSGEAVHGAVVDADTGAPLEGAVIVARWEAVNEQGRYARAQPLHLAEGIAGRDGRYAIAGWGPKSRTGVRPDDHDDPMLAVFSPGYEPLVLRNEGWKDLTRHNPAQRRSSEWNGKTIKLHRSTGPEREYAQRIAQFQSYGRGGGLRWLDDGAWKAMPAMVRAIHVEKRRLGKDGEAIIGVERMPGRSGEGGLVDDRTGERVVGAPPRIPILSITWTLRKEKGSATSKYVQQRRTSDRFSISPWSLPSPPLPSGWDFAYEIPPLVTVYSPGYQHVAAIAWPEAGMTVRMRKLDDTRDATLAELRAWRRDVDRALAADPVAGALGQRELIRDLIAECRTLVPDARAGICLDPESEIVRVVEQSFRSPPRAPTPPQGWSGGVVSAMSGTSAVSGQLSARPVTLPAPPRARFSIEPVPPKGGRSAS